MKKPFTILFAILSTIVMFATIACEKEEEPETTVTDIDGNVYDIIEIGTQSWMAENLKVTRLNDGSGIDNTTDNNTWSTLSGSAYCWYDNNASNKNAYGGLYNYYAVQTGKLCPMGWHVPTKNDWEKLQTFLGGEGVAGGKMKETGTTYWASPNTGANNESGFNARGGGVRLSNGTFGDLKNYGLWWSSSADGAMIWFVSINYANGNLATQAYGKTYGYRSDV